MNTQHSSNEPNEVEGLGIESNAYQAPAIESVLTPESLEREVHYAGVTPVSGNIAAA